MRVAIISRLPGTDREHNSGLFRTTVDQANVLAKSGVDVTVLSLQTGLGHVAAGLDPRVKVVYVSRPGRALNHLTLFLVAAGRLTMALRKLGEFDGVIVHATPETGLAAALLQRYRPLLMVHGIYRRETRPTGSSAWRWALWAVSSVVEKFYLWRCRFVLATSEDIERLLQNGRTHVTRITNPVPDEYFDLYPGPDRDPLAPVVVHIGATVPRKGLDLLVEAWSEVAARFPGATLSIVGQPGPGDEGYYQSLRKRAADLPQIHWLGPIDDRALVALLSTATVLVHPSRADTAPLVIAQAQAAGVTVLASRVGAIPDMLDEGRAGYLIDGPLTAASVASELIEVLSTPPEHREPIRVRARDLAEDRFRGSSVARSLIAVLSKSNTSKSKGSEAR